MYEKMGYTTQLTEFLTSRPIGGGKIIYVKKDVFGADGISMNREEIIFWNSKFMSTKHSGEQSRSSGKLEFAKYPFPSSVKKQIVIWETRKDPVIYDIL